MLGALLDNGKRIILELIKDKITYCALGDCSGEQPLVVDATGTDLINEQCRKKITNSYFLESADASGDNTLSVMEASGVAHYEKVDYATQTIGFVTIFDEDEANGFAIREVGLFSDSIIALNTSNGYAENGLYDASSNPTGEVIDIGNIFSVFYPTDITTKSSLQRVRIIRIIKVE